ncbi:hypothetical protein PEC18_16295 [Paucibacter sp. O1-1]|nr:hypothetical protein [Paucibacter sp. O1-1]MDA3827373.1 hypothetical protein [Paucibacter sp. O1-1]
MSDLPHAIFATLLAALLLSPVPGHAGRPLNVDDANVNEVGAGHLEAWYARQPGDARLWTVAPAYAPWQGIELGAAWAREQGSAINSTSLQSKIQLSTPHEGRWHHAAVLGLTHTRFQHGATRYATLIASREFPAGALHINLGASRTPGGPTLPALGLAWEQALGAATGHLEWLGQRQSKPLFGLGLRREVFKDLQLDGSLGRSGGSTLYSLGLKLQF